MKKYDLCVKAGETKEGKAIWENVGALLNGEKGDYIVLKSTFNPAGVQSKNGSILISCFQPKAKQQQPSNFESDEIPF